MEDNPADVSLVREALEEHDIEGELVVLFDGEKAIQFIGDLDSQASTGPDLLIVDLNLPRKSGREVLERIRKSEKCRETPVAVLTSSDTQRDKSDAARLGASLYICKPSTLEEFLKLGNTFKAILGGPVQ